jgi:hypothetical protein
MTKTIERRRARATQLMGEIAKAQASFLYFAINAPAKSQPVDNADTPVVARVVHFAVSWGDC